MSLIKQRPLLALTSFALLATSSLAFYGCGSGGSTTAGPVTKAKFVTQASAICRASQEDRKGATEGLDKGDEGADVSAEAEAGMEALIAPVSAMISELASLGAPKGEGPRVTEIVTAFEAGVKKLEADPTSPDVASAFATADRQAEEYGLVDCTV